MKLKGNRCSNNASALIALMAFGCFLTTARADGPAASPEAFAHRGAILIQACEYEAAEVILDRALDLQPDLRSAQFDRARIPLLKRNWTEARHRFKAMLSTAGDHDEKQLIQYEILLTDLMAGDDSAVTEVVQELKQNPESAAFRYAQAALARDQGAPQEAARLAAAAREKTSGSLAPLYAESFYDVGWEERAPREAQFSPNEPEKNLARFSNSDQP